MRFTKQFNKIISQKEKFYFLLLELLLGFVLFILAGAVINYIFQNASLKREQEFEKLKMRSEKSQNTVDEVSALIMNRLFAQQRVIWALESGRINNAEELIEKYKSDAVVEWNTKAYIYKNKVARYLGSDLAEELISSEKLQNKTVLEYFSRVHVDINEWNHCVLKKCILAKNQKKRCNQVCNEAQKTLADFDQLSKFVKNYTEKLDNRYYNIFVKIEK